MTDKGESLVDCYRKWRAWADAEVCCDYGLHSLVSWWEEGTTDREMEQLATEEGWREGRRGERRGGEGNGRYFIGYCHREGSVCDDYL